ncbi:MAG: RNA polymerase sigma factor [Gemmatimonadota bacterium]|nr:RNA polymerase sigma factor [Gemmatimonadota bacterium]
MVTSDAVIVTRIREGESEAFSVLFERYHDRCVRLASRLLGDPDDVADAVQDAFIRAFLSLDSYQERDRFGSWLLCIVANRCRTPAERARRQSAIGAEWTGLHEPEMEGGFPATRDHALVQRLHDALCTLPASTRTVVLRKYGEGLTYEELSSETGIAVSALKMRVARASAQLRRTLVGAGVTIVTVAMIFVSHGRESRKPRTATVIACDTLRAIMRDTLGPGARDSLLPAERCAEAKRGARAAKEPKAGPPPAEQEDN